MGNIFPEGKSKKANQDLFTYINIGHFGLNYFTLLYMHFFVSQAMRQKTNKIIKLLTLEKRPKKRTTRRKKYRKLTMRRGVRRTSWHRSRRGRGAPPRMRASLSLGFGGGSNVIGPWLPFVWEKTRCISILEILVLKRIFFTLVSDKGHKMWLVYIQITSPYPMADGHEVLMLLGFLTSSPPYCYR